MLLASVTRQDDGEKYVSVKEYPKKECLVILAVYSFLKKKIKYRPTLNHPYICLNAIIM
jgi:hypothetical protein